MSKFSTEAKVGLFTIVAIIILVYATFKLGGFKVDRDPGIRLFAMFDSASGLKVAVPVEIAGIEIGQVETIGLKQGRANVGIRIRSNIALRVTSRAVIRTSGVLGDKFIEIIPGQAKGVYLKDGDTIQITQTPAEVDQLINKISDISSDIKSVTESLSRVFGGGEGADSMQIIFLSLRETADALAAMVTANQDSFQTIVENLSSFSEDMKMISNNNKDDIQTIMENITLASAQLNKTISLITEVIDKVNRGQGTLGELVNDDSTLKNLNDTIASLKAVLDKINQGQGALGALVTDSESTRNIDKTLASIQEITTKINEGEGTLGRLLNDQTTVDKIDEGLASLNRMLGMTESIKVMVDYHSDYLFNDGELKTYLRVKIQPREDKYYLFGVVDDPRGTYSKKITKITDSSGETTSTSEKWDPDGLKYDAQMAKRFYNVVFRGGIFESTGGLGLDYYLFKDQLQLVAEAFDFGRESDNAHVKLAASYSFLDLFYMDLGYDDLLSKKRGSFFFGLGLRFTDDDLKYLIGNIPLP